MGAGGLGKDIQTIAKELFQPSLKNLTANKNKNNKKTAQQTQLQGRKEICVHEIGTKPCQRDIILAKDGFLKPSKSCARLLSVRAFRNAMSQLPPKDEHRIFVRLIFRHKRKDQMMEGPVRGEQTWI
jgi:hypothetical protein